MKRIFFVALLAAATFGTTNVDSASAQYRGNWSASSTRAWYGNTGEGLDGFDNDDIQEWRRQNNRVSSAIDDLSADAVDDLPIPVLFGVSLSDLFPNFGDPRDGGARSHEGEDIMAAEGTPVVSPTEAVVIRVGNGSGSGLYVSTANPGGETFVYMHLSETADIKAGDKLEAGDLIGYVGSTGNAAGGPAHLHFEIRDGREPTDPFPRLTREFTLKEKIAFLEDLLEDIDDPDELAEWLVTEYQNVFVQARVAGINLPKPIEDFLPSSARAILVSGIPRVDLQLGDTGAAVTILQSILINLGFLNLSTPTDLFGPLTQAALITYQKANGITPAAGYFGAVTRAQMSGDNPSASGLNREQLIAEIQRLQKLIAARQ